MRASFKSKRDNVGKNPDVSPKGSRNVGIKVENDGTADPRSVPSDFGTPSFTRPAQVTGQPKY